MPYTMDGTCSCHAKYNKNYKVLQEFWEQAADVARDTETIARIQRVASHMKTFEYFFGLVFGEMYI